MNCEQFRRRMDFVLDRRGDASTDQPLADHAASCDECRQRLQTWSVIDNLVGPPSLDSDCGDLAAAGPIGNLRRPASATVVTPGRIALAITTAVMVCVSPMLLSSRRSANESSSGSIVAVESVTEKQRSGSIESPNVLNDLATESPSMAGGSNTSRQADQWWLSLPDERWMLQSIPAVDSVRQGVAPLGRSMKRAIAIMMIRTETTPLDHPNVAPESPTETPQEQTSDVRPRVPESSFV